MLLTATIETGIEEYAIFSSGNKPEKAVQISTSFP
jgi:hypothetical protein